jgi:hypothetical protein
MSATNLLQGGLVSLEIEGIHHQAHPDNEFVAFR